MAASGSEVLEYGDLPELKLSQNVVIVRMRAAAINPADTALQAGLGESPMETGFRSYPDGTSPVSWSA
jgi:NADPH:quinone reductase-like Zn-dependent oxidoreductase